MIIQRKHHKVPGLNTTSTADISFMLLIFFLVTTNMDVDKGLQRQLPPTDKQVMTESFVDESTTMTLSLTADNHLLVDNHQQPIGGLRDRVIAFVNRTGKNHLIILKSDPAANYDTYFHVQNELASAYNTLLNQTAVKLYHKSYAALSPQQKDDVRAACPQRIAEQYNGQEGGSR